jgi:hypothetical protein
MNYILIAWFLIAPGKYNLVEVTRAETLHECWSIAHDMRLEQWACVKPNENRK